MLSLCLFYASISVLNLMRAATREPLQGDKERCDMGPFGFAEDQSCCSMLKGLIVHDGSPARRALQ